MQERFKIHPLWNEIWYAQFSNLLKPHGGQSVDSSKSEQPTNFQKSQLKQSSNYPAGEQVINQFVKVSVKAVIL